MKSGDEFVAKVKEFKEYDKNVDGLLVEVRSRCLCFHLSLLDYYGKRSKQANFIEETAALF